MNIRKEKEEALAIIEEYKRVCEGLEEGETYGSHVENFGGIHPLVVMNARDDLDFLGKVEGMADAELERFRAIKGDDMREVKDLKDKYGLTWNQVKRLRAGVEREPMTVKEMRRYLGLSKTEFAKKYDIPARTLDSWESGERTPAPYILKLLVRAVKEDK